MLLERVLAHYDALGWTLASETTVGVGAAAFHPDLVLVRDGKKLAVHVSEEPLGSYQVGLFGARCRRARTDGLVVCPSSPEVLEACTEARVDFLSSEVVGEPVVVPIARARRLVPEPAEERAVEFEEFSVPSRVAVYWRWVLVIMIWVAAIAATAYWLTLVF